MHMHIASRTMLMTLQHWQSHSNLRNVLKLVSSDWGNAERVTEELLGIGKLKNSLL